MDAARALPGQNPDGSDGDAVRPPSWTVDERVTARDPAADPDDSSDPAGSASAGSVSAGSGSAGSAVADAAPTGADSVLGEHAAVDVGPDDAVVAPTPSADAADDPNELTARDRKILEFEHHWWRYAGAKEQAIRTAFAVSATRYYQLLNSLIDKPAALVADPMLVRRLRRLRADRRRSRAGRPRPSGI